MSDDDNKTDLGRRKFLGDGAKVLTSAALASQFPFIKTHAAEAEIVKPTYQLHSSCAWIAGEEDFLDDTDLDHDDPARVNKNHDQAFFLASVAKPFTHLVVLRMLAEGKLDPDEELTMSQYALSRSINSVFANDLLKDNFVVLDGERKNTLSLSQAMEYSGPLSGNDAHIAIVERVAFGNRVPKDISPSVSRRLERKFIDENLTPLFEELGMVNTQIRTTTGLPFNAAQGDPADFENFSSHRDLMKFWNIYNAEFHDDLAMYRTPEKRIQRIYRDPDTNKWRDRTKRFVNATPNIETSVKMDDKNTASIPIPFMDSGKSGLNDFCIWQAMQRYNLEGIGGKGEVFIWTTGDANDSYATHPKSVHDNVVDLLEPTIKPAPIFKHREEEDIFGPEEPHLLA